MNIRLVTQEASDNKAGDYRAGAEPDVALVTAITRPRVNKRWNLAAVIFFLSKY